MGTENVRQRVILIVDGDKEYLKACLMALRAKGMTHVFCASTTDETAILFAEKFRSGTLLVVGETSGNMFKANTILELAIKLAEGNRFTPTLIANGGDGKSNQQLLEAGCKRAISRKSDLVSFITSYGESQAPRENRALGFR
jgi:hypothetical protein